MTGAGISIRDYREGDFPCIEDLWKRTGVGGSERGDDHQTISNTLIKGGKFIVMEDISSGKITGTSWITNDGRRLYLHHFAILPEYQGKGLSKHLLDASLHYARRLRMQIKLEVHRNNMLATEIYLKGGFKYLGDYLVYIIRDPNRHIENITE